MKNIIKISITELRKIFYTPVGWIVLTVFIMQNSILFFNLLQQYWLDQTTGFYVPELTGKLFGGNDAVLKHIIERIYWYVPLITMGLISQEKNAGTIKLLQASPVKCSSIVLGKYLGTLFFGTILLCFVLLLVVLTTIFVPKLDCGWVISGLVGIYLLYAAYCAIGLFMSSLTKYQVVAAVSTFAVFMGLDYIGTVWQNIPIIQDVTFFLHISGRADQFVDGLISSRNVIYFLLIITLFLLLTVWKITGETEKKGWKKFFFKYLMLFAGCLFVGWASLNPYLSGYLDCTADRHMTISKQSAEMLQGFKDKLKIHAYVNILSYDVFWGLPGSKNQRAAFFEPYCRFKPDLNFDYTFYYDTTTDIIDDLKRPGVDIKTLAEQKAKELDIDFKEVLSPQAIHAIVDLRPEGSRFIWQLQYQDHKSFLRLYSDVIQVPKDQEWANALKQLYAPSPEIIFLTGNGERSVTDISDKGYSKLATQPDFRRALISQGYKVVSINVDSLSYNKRMAVVVIADPILPFSDTQLKKIAAYTQSGGNLMVCGETGRATIINPAIQNWGVKLSDSTLYQTRDGAKSNLLTPQITQEANVIPQFQSLNQQDLRLTFPGTAKLNIRSNVALLLYTIDQERSAKIEKRVVNPVMVALIRGKQKIVVTGDADWLSNAEFKRSHPSSQNLDLAGPIFSWFANGLFPVSLTKINETDYHISANGTQINIIFWLFVVVLPSCLLISGLIFRRKRNSI